VLPLVVGLAVAAISPVGSSSAGPSAPTVGPVLYDQLDAATFANPADITSQDFETTLDAADAETADDVVVPAGMTWSIDGIDVDGEYFSRDGQDPVPAGFQVRFWSNDPATNLPATLYVARPSQPYTAFGTAPGDVQIALGSPVVLAAGTWWISVQARLDYGAGTDQWFWHNRTVQSNQGAVWRNPGNAWQTGCTSFSRRATCQGSSDPDQAFRLHGTAATVGAPPPPPPPPAPARCRVPRVVGKKLGRAASLILRAHCRVGRVSRRTSARKRRGKVLAQSPRAGRSLPLNSRVRLVVGR
jgi:hypothetical protein